MSSNDLSFSHKIYRPIIDDIAHESINEIVEKRLHRQCTPDILREIKFKLQQNGYDVRSISVISKDDIYSLDTTEDYIVHSYNKDGIWENKTI